MSELISIQKAIEKINERARGTFTLDLGYEYYLGALHDVADDLRQIPTIDAVPVVHGEWKEAPTAWRCSVCECDAPHTYPHCPFCGAKMDGGKEDEITP